MALIISEQIIILIHMLDNPMLYASDNTSRFNDDIAFVTDVIFLARGRRQKPLTNRLIICFMVTTEHLGLSFSIYRV